MPAEINEAFDGLSEKPRRCSEEQIIPPTIWSTSNSRTMPVPRRKSNSKDQSILHALLPGARFQKHTKKILVHTSTSNETIRFNIGGTMFETHKATLRGIPNCVLASDAFLAKHYRQEERDYFFDRDPEIFHCILNYLRTGEMHLPTSVCGPVVKLELEFWGIEETEIEECCWSRYSTWSKALRELRQLEEDRKKSMLQWDIPDLPPRIRGWKRFKQDAWKFVSNPSSSICAQIYGYLAIIIIGISIFCFCARTHVDFQVENTRLVKNEIPRSSSQTGDKLSSENSLISSNVSSSSSSSLSSSPSNSSSLSSNDSWSSSNVSSSYKRETILECHPFLLYLDVMCFLFLAIELVARILVCPRKVRFLGTSMTLVEILALIPDLVYYLAMATHTPDVERAFEVMQLFRVMRIFRLMRQMPGLWILVYTLKSSVKDLLLLLLFLFTGTLISSTLIYFAEKDTQDSFSSIPKCFWWSVITMTTVGYGDMYPVTQWGYLIGTITAISGLLMVSFTVPVLVNNFILYYNHTESHIQREQQRLKSMKRSQLHLITHAAKELQQSGLHGNERRRMSPLNFNLNSFMVPIDEDEDEEEKKTSRSDDIVNVNESDDAIVDNNGTSFCVDNNNKYNDNVKQRRSNTDDNNKTKCEDDCIEEDDVFEEHQNERSNGYGLMHDASSHLQHTTGL